MNFDLRDELVKTIEKYSDDDVLKIEIEILLAKSELLYISNHECPK